jgi:hypothetical protein
MTTSPAMSCRGAGGAYSGAEGLLKAVVVTSLMFTWANDINYMS